MYDQNSAQCPTEYYSATESSMNASEPSQATSYTIFDLDTDQVITEFLEYFPCSITENQNPTFNCQICHSWYGTPNICFHQDIHKN